MQVVVDAIPPQCLVSTCATREFDFQTIREEELHDFTIPLDLPVGGFSALLKWLCCNWMRRHAKSGQELPWVLQAAQLCSVQCSNVFWTATAVVAQNKSLEELQTLVVLSCPPGMGTGTGRDLANRLTGRCVPR